MSNKAESNEQDYSKLTKAALLKLIEERDPEAAENLEKSTKAVLILWLQADDEVDGKRSMAATLLRYRETYTDTVSHSNRLSKSNGDQIAEFLAGQEPKLVMQAVERILELEEGFLTEKYASLNLGQQRMNAGNRLRAALKRGDISESQLKLH